MLKKEKTIYALGFFDGVHLGHQALLSACLQLAQQQNCNAGAVTFDTHPETLVKGNAPLLINTIDERQHLLLSYGITHILVLPFDDHLRNMPWSAFLEMLLEQGAAGFVCGDDFRFGYRGEGDPAKLAQFCRQRQLPWSIVNAQNLDGTRISSTYIRQLLETGEMTQAVRFLGHPYRIDGTVVPGKQLGRTIGIPTANLMRPPEVICLRHGVYACKALVDGTEYPAVTNIGTRPTVSGENVTVEAHLLHYQGDLYGKFLTLVFYAFLRPEQKFDSLDALQAQIRKDAATTLELLT